MILCSRCKKRPAVVFITALSGDTKKNEGLCMLCAKEMKIPQMQDYMEQLGITDEEIEQILAWPMCSCPVTLGGGITMVNGFLPSTRWALKAPDSSHSR